MSAYSKYKQYTAIKRHFESEYDYFKYHGSIRCQSEDNFLRRNDLYFFDRLNRTYKKDSDSELILVFGFFHECIRFVGDIFKINMEEFNRFRGVLDCPEYYYKQMMNEYGWGLTKKQDDYIILNSDYIYMILFLGVFDWVNYICGKGYEPNIFQRDRLNKIQKILPFISRRVDFKNLKKLTIQHFKEKNT